MRSNKTIYCTLVVFVAWLLVLSVAAAQNTAFTYQGLLKTEGLPSNGEFDFQFKLFDAETEGNQVGSTLTMTGITVTNGLFGVSLDFGMSAFTGEPRWLEIAAKNPADTEYTTLTPRVTLTPVPYSIYAYTANAIKLQGRPLDMVEPTLNQVLQWDGLTWKPASVIVYTAGAGLQLSLDNEFSIADNGVITTMIADNAVTNPKLADNAVSTSKIQDNAVTSPKLADNAVSTNKIQDNAVTSPKLADNAVSTSKIQDNAVTSPKLADNAVSTSKIQDNAVTSLKLADNAVSTSKIQDNAVTTPKLADNSVTTAKIADNAVTTPKLADNAVSTAKIQNNAVTLAKINPAGALVGQALSWNGTNLVWAYPVASGIALPFAGTANVAGPGYVFGIANTGTGAGILGTAVGAQASGVHGQNDNATGAGVSGHSANGFGVNGFSSNNIGVSGKAGTGANPALPTGTGVLGISTAAGGEGVRGVATANNTIGVRGIADAGANAIGVNGTSTTGTGVKGTSTANNGTGVLGESNNGANAIGVNGTSTTGTGVKGTSTANNGTGVLGESNNGANAIGVNGTSTTGTGVKGTSTANNGTGVLGESNNGANAIGVNGTSTTGTGVKGTSTANNGTGVLGESNNGANAIGVNGTSTTGTGVKGTSTAAGGDGVLGTGGNNGNGVRGVANLGGAGAFGVLGTSTVGSGVVGRAGAALAAPPALTGVFGTTDNAGSDGVRGLATGANGNGVRGIADVGGANAFGVHGTSTVGSGVVGRAGAALAAPPALTGVFGTTDNAGSDGVRGLATGANGNGVRGIADVGGANAFGVHGTSTVGSGVVGRAGAGVVPVPPALTGVYGITGNAGTAGVHGVNNVAGGFGVLGQSTGGAAIVGRANGALDAPINNTAVFGVTSAAGRAIGLHGLVTGNNGHGVRGVANVGVQAWGVVGSSTTGTGVVGLHGLDPTAATSPAGTGVFGATSADLGVGVRGTTSGMDGDGVRGTATGAGTNSFGVFGLSTNGTGVVGSTGAALVGAPTSRSGVFGITNIAAGYGVLGVHTVAGRDAVFAAGNLGASGAKTFRIDHPLDPANKYLLHYCSEGPEPLNVYRGNVVLDAKGEAWVQLPNYFESINRDWSYTLTAIGGAAPNLHVSQEVTNNRFRIAGGSPGMKVSWRVEAVRNDLYMRQHGAPVELDKPREERGRFQFPELYGMPKELGIFFVPLVETDKQ